MASMCADHWSMSTTSSPAFVRSAATQLPFAPVPRTAIFFSMVFPGDAPSTGRSMVVDRRIGGGCCAELEMPSAFSSGRFLISASLRLQIVQLDEPGHALDVLMQKRGERLGCVLDGHISKLLETLFRLRHSDGLRH